MDVKPKRINSSKAQKVSHSIILVCFSQVNKKCRQKVCFKKNKKQRKTIINNY